MNNVTCLSSQANRHRKIDLGVVDSVAIRQAMIFSVRTVSSGWAGQAAAEFQKIIDHSGIVWNCWTGDLARLGVARANALEAKTSQGADADAAAFVRSPLTKIS